MKKILFFLCAILPSVVGAQTFETRYERSVHDLMEDVARRFDVRFKFDANVDTVGKQLPYADFRVRSYSLEMTLDNICKYYDWNWWKQSGNLYKIKLYEYPRRHEAEGKMMLDWLSSLYHNKEQWEARRDSLRREVRQRLELDAFLDSCVTVPDGSPSGKRPVILSKIRKHDGYTTQNICIELTPGQHLFGTIYASTKKGKHALIVCPDGHWPYRYRKDEQQRLGTLARMGAVCVDFDLYGWGESEKEVGEAAHHTSRAHVYQAACGYILLDWMLKNRKDIDPERVGVMGGSGGGTHTVLLSLLDERVTASAPVVHLASHFDGGCPCESGKPVQLAAGGTCEPELAAIMAPKPMLIVSDGGDWTSSVPTLEFPYLQRIYGFYGAQDKVRNVHLPNERHDFKENKRNAVYDFFIDVFSLDRSMLDESKITIEPDDALKSLYK
ncbi:MAG: hypothetical protein IJQ49_07125 [Prevotella sp.]|nr:hypothetical protein [Prevotella sp.]